MRFRTTIQQTGKNTTGIPVPDDVDGLSYSNKSWHVLQGAGCASAPRLSSPACRTPGRLAPACPSAAPRPRAGWSSAWTTTAARPS